MKRALLIICTLLAATTLSAQSLTVGSYNIRVANDNDARKGDGWESRHIVLCEQIRWHDFDIFGAQEVTRPQLEDMLAQLPEYDFIGGGRDDGKMQGELSPIIYKRDKFKILDSGMFWISENPDRVGVKGWDAALPRICTYAHIKDRTTGEKFWFFSLHMDHIGVEARREGAKLIQRKVAEMCHNERAVVVGDFNVDQHNEAYKTMLTSGMLADAYDVALHRFATNGTFQGFNSAAYTKSRIDHIFVTQDVTVSNYAILTDAYWREEGNGGNAGEKNHQRRVPSDHYPVAAKIEFKR